MKRAGTTLLETIFVIAVASMLFSCLSMAMIRVMRVERSTRHFLDQALDMTRLADRLTADVRQAVGAEQLSGDSSAGVRLQIDDQQTIQYRLEEHEIRRDQQMQGTVTQRDAFKIGQGDRVTWNIERPSAEDDSSPVFVTLEIRAADGRPRLAKIVTQLRRDRRSP